MPRSPGAEASFCKQVGAHRIESGELNFGGCLVVGRVGASKAGTCLVLLAVLALTVAAAGCGSSSKSSSALTTNTIDAGQVDLQLPPGWTVTKDGKGAIRPASDVATAGGSGASAPGGSSTADTIPLAKVDPTTKFFGALGTFQSCLKGLNVKFIGIPDAKNPSSPTNDPAYLKALSTCAAKSNIVQALKDEQTAQDNLTPAQIKLQNKGYLKFRDCMISRGWGIPEPKPDSKGRLFSFGAGGGGGGSVPGFKPPPGKDLLTSSDVTECATQAQKEVSPNTGG
jgi:hypothetical protein